MGSATAVSIAAVTLIGGAATGAVCVLDSEGRKLQVEEKYMENLEESVKVYNFEVEEYHTYYVGDAGILVHNKCWDDPPIDSAGDYKKGVDIKTVGGKGHDSSVGILNRKGKWMTRRWFDENGAAVRDVDLTYHNNPKKHPEVPHEHRWINGDRIE